MAQIAASVVLSPAMSLPVEQREQAIEWLRDLFEADLTRLLLSILIILSVLPFAWVERYSVLFFGIFAVELGLRLLVLRHELRQRAFSRTEIVVLALDTIATLSFLPLEPLVGARFLRLFRLTRMLMLLSYWGGLVREVWVILMKRERRYQLAFVASVVVILTFLSAILLWHYRTVACDPAGSPQVVALCMDYNEDGRIDGESFWTVLWWSFRQLQDPGNLLRDPRPTLAFLFSALLSLSGVFVVAFLIGIGATVVEELVKVGRKRRLGMRYHSVIANVGPHSRPLVDDLVSYYAKTFRSPRLVTMGPAPERYPYMYSDALRRVRYRQGKPISHLDLALVDTDRATRVILLGDPTHKDSDSAVVSQVLSVREANPTCVIHAELFHPGNVAAAMSAGGIQTVPTLARQMVSMLIADLVALPGLEPVYDELLSSRGDEIYTCVYARGQLTDLPPPSAQLPPFADLLVAAYHSHGVILLGFLLEDARAPTGFAHVLNPGPSRYRAVPEVDRLRGFFAVAASFEHLKALLRDLPDVAAAPPPRPTTADVPHFRLCTSTRRVQRVLICGDNEGLPELCAQLVAFCPKVQIFVMVPESGRIAALARRFTARAEDLVNCEPGERRVCFVEGQGGQLRCEMEDKPLEAGVVFLAGDWSRQQSVMAQPKAGYQLEEMDVVLLSYVEEASDPDAATSLGLLKLLRLLQSARASPRVLCEVRSVEKAELLQRRFGRATRSSDEASCEVTVVPAERLRNAFMAQAIFVPGIGEIYQEMLSTIGHEICALEPLSDAPLEGELSFAALLEAMYRHEHLILLAVELHDERDNSTRVLLNPPPRSADARFPARQLRRVFAVGDSARPGGRAPCAGSGNGGTDVFAEPPVIESA